VASAEAYLRAKSHLDPSNRLATIHQNYGQDTQDKPVGFYGPIAPPGPNARRMSSPIPSSENGQNPNFRTHSVLNLWKRPMSSFWTYVFAACLCHTLPAANGVVRSQRIGACSKHAVPAAGA